jgi:hypothetical protein
MKKLKLSKCDLPLLNGKKITLDKSTGYYRILLGNNKYIYLHRYIMNAKKGDIIDHIDRYKNNNQRCNLRFVTFSENNYNREVKNNLGRGIYFDKSGNRFRACISFKNKTLKLGSFKDIEKAKIAYNIKAKEIHGDSAFQHLIITENGITYPKI